MQWEKKRAFLCEHKNYVINCLSRRRLFFLLACLEISEWRHVLLPCHLIKKDKDDSLNFPWRNSWVARINATIIIQIIVTFFTLPSPWRTANDSLESAKILWSFTRNFPRLFTTLSGRLWKRMSGVARPEFCEHKSIRLHTSKRFPFKLSSRTIFSLFFRFVFVRLCATFDCDAVEKFVDSLDWFTNLKLIVNIQSGAGLFYDLPSRTAPAPMDTNCGRLKAKRRASHLKINSLVSCLHRFFICVSFHFIFFSSVKMWLQASGNCESRPRSEEKFWKQLKFLAVAKKRVKWVLRWWNGAFNWKRNRLCRKLASTEKQLWPRTSSILIVYRRIKKSRLGMGSGLCHLEDHVTR